MSDKIALYTSIAIVMLSLIVAITDYRTRRIHNWNVLLVSLVGISGHVLLSAWSDLFFGILLAIGVTIVLMPFFAMGGLGAGDVKYLASVAIWLGLERLLFALLVGTVLLVGYAFLIMLFRGELSQYIQSMFVRATMGVRQFFNPTEDRMYLPYGVFLAIGVLVAVVWG